MTARQRITKAWRIFYVSIIVGIFLLAFGVFIHWSIALGGAVLALAATIGLTAIGRCDICNRRIGYMFQQADGYQRFGVSKAINFCPYCGTSIDLDEAAPAGEKS